MPFSIRLTLHIVSVVLLSLLSGCGERTVIGQSGGSKLEQSQTCIDCHQAAGSPVTGKNIVEEWKLSHHNTFNGAGCADCHEPTHGHPTGCNLCHGGAPVVSVSDNPDRDSKCDKCHSRLTGLFPTIGAREAHFNNITSGVIPRTYTRLYFSNISTYVIKNSSNATANWASSGYKPIKGDASKYGCRACHNPHDTTSKMSILRQWARSGHGDPVTGARTGADFKARGSNDAASTTVGAVCVRCHTSTGFINYVKSDYNSVAAFASANGPDHSKEVTGCNVCHDDGNGNAYGYNLRNVLQANPGRSGVPAYYNYSAASGGNSKASPSTTVRGVQITYPNVSSSNICIVCHMGREIGLVIKRAGVNGLDFTKTSRISAHDFAAGSNLFQESGFEFYTSAAKYPDTSIRHTNAGMNNFQGTGSRGPCVACHMSSTESHSFMPVTKDLSGVVTSITSLTCAKCHPSTVANNKNMNKDILENNRQGFKAAMTVLRGLLVRSGSKIIGTLSSVGGVSYKTDWSKACTGTVAALSSSDGVNFVVPGSGNLAGGSDAIRAPVYSMGAAFNYELLYADFGSYVHNPNYVKRLIFDSIDWLDDCSLSTQGGADVCSGVITDATAKAYLCGTTNLRP